MAPPTPLHRAELERERAALLLDVAKRAPFLHMLLGLRAAQASVNRAVRVQKRVHWVRRTVRRAAAAVRRVFRSFRRRRG